MTEPSKPTTAADEAFLKDALTEPEEVVEEAQPEQAPVEEAPVEPAAEVPAPAPAPAPAVPDVSFQPAVILRCDSCQAQTGPHPTSEVGPGKTLSCSCGGTRRVSGIVSGLA